MLQAQQELCFILSLQYGQKLQLASLQKKYDQFYLYMYLFENIIVEWY